MNSNLVIFISLSSLIIPALLVGFYYFGLIKELKAIDGENNLSK